MPFSLIIVAFGLGLIAGMDPGEVITTVNHWLRQFHARHRHRHPLRYHYRRHAGQKRRGGDDGANIVLNAVGPKYSTLAINIIGYIVSIPVFCDSGFIILSSLNNSLARRSGVPMAVMAVSLSTGLYAAHRLIPPTPGPTAAAGNLHADLGMVILFGLLVAIPMPLAGYFWATRFCTRIPTKNFDASDLPEEQFAAQG